MDSREDWDHRTPNLLDDNDEALVAQHNPTRQRRNQPRLETIHPPSLQHRNSSRTRGADSHRVQRDDVSPQGTTQLANEMRDSLRLHETSPDTYGPQGASPEEEHNPPAYRQSEPLTRSTNSYATTTGDPRIVVAIDYGTTYTGKRRIDHRY
jgi:hypothetical protein